MKLKKLIDECYDALCEDIKEQISEGNTFATVTIDTNDGYLDVACDEYSKVEVTVHHDDEEREHKSDNLEEFLAKKLNGMIDWDLIEEDVHGEEYYDEWNEHGFRDAADFWHWKEGL